MIPVPTSQAVTIFMGIALFGSGMITIVVGMWRILAHEFHGTMKSLAVQSARIGQKFITDDVAGIADSAARLMDALNQLVRTNAGIGAFLALFGMLQVLLGYWIVTR
ncbi:MAG: hypothetical protein HY260_04285 [Chloroflexi bacterium]|nr:hypothetical protein [Chloroflexota bacterium]